MSAKTKAKSSKTAKNRTSASIVWFEIPADDAGRAKKFYSQLFGWKINKFPDMDDYWHIDTGGGDDTPDGGMMKRKHPGQGITNYIAVASVEAASAKIEKLGGKICMPKTAVPEMGYFAICQDTESNMFAIWERTSNAK